MRFLSIFNPPEQVRDAINWHYFQQVPKTTSHLLNSLIKIQTEIAYELPLFKTIELLTTPYDLQRDQIVFSDHNISLERQKVENKSATSGKLLDFGAVEQRSVNSDNLFVYVFHHSNSMDMRGSINYFGGEHNSLRLFCILFPLLTFQARSIALTCRSCSVRACSSRSAGSGCRKLKTNCARSSSSFSAISLKRGE